MDDITLAGVIALAKARDNIHARGGIAKATYYEHSKGNYLRLAPTIRDVTGFRSAVNATAKEKGVSVADAYKDVRKQHADYLRSLRNNPDKTIQQHFSLDDARRRMYMRNKFANDPGGIPRHNRPFVSRVPKAPPNKRNYDLNKIGIVARARAK